MLNLNSRLVEIEVRRTNRNLFLWSLGLAATIAWTLLSNLDYFRNFVNGPYEIGYLQLALPLSAEERVQRYVKISGDELIPTGIQEFSIRKDRHSGREISRQTTSDYLMLTLGDRFLLIKAPYGRPNVLTYEGVLEEIPHDLLTEIVWPIENSRSELRGVFFAQMLNCRSYREDGYLAMILLLPVTILMLAGFYLWYRRTVDISLHPLVSQLARYGNLGDVSYYIDSEFSSCDAIRINNHIVTRNFLLYRGYFNSQIIPVGAINRAYMKVTKHSVNFVPIYYSSKLIVETSKLRYELRMLQVTGDTLIRELHKRNSTAVYGYF